MNRFFLALACVVMGCVPDEVRSLRSTDIGQQQYIDSCVRACGVCLRGHIDHPGMGLPPDEYVTCRDRRNSCLERCAP